MKIERLTLEKYGAFADRTLSFRSDADVHIVLGRNEAGKTSALSAIGDLLFDFPHRTPYDFLHGSQSLRLGASLRLSDGSVLEFRRRKGRNNTIIDASDKSLGDDLLARVTGTMTRETFESEFGLTSESLRKGGAELLKAGGRLADSLAAGSATLSALNALRAALQRDADELFTARKVASKPFYELADRLAGLREQLRAATITAEALEKAQAALAEAQERRSRLEQEHQNSGTELARLERAQRTFAKIAQLTRNEQALAAFADLPDTSAAQEAQWAQALQRAAELAGKLKDAHEHLAGLQQAAADVPAAPEMLAAAQQIEALNRELGAIQKAREDLPRREEASRNAGRELEAAAAKLALPSASELLARMPAEPALASLRELLQQRRRLDDRLTDFRQRLTDKKSELQDLREQAAPEDAAGDPSQLEQELSLFDAIPRDADQLRDMRATDTQILQGLQNDCARLNPSPGSLEELVRAPLPSMDNVERVRQLWEDFAGKRKELQRDAAGTDTRITDLASQIETLGREGAIATRADLEAARAQRDTAFDELERGLDADADTRRRAFGALKRQSEDADRVADRLLDNADRAARKQALAQDLEAAKAHRNKLQADLDALSARQETANGKWLEMWRPCNIVPLHPATMRDWLQQAGSIIDRHVKRTDALVRMTALEERLAGQQPALDGLLDRLHVPASASLPLEARHAAARKALAHARERWNATRERAASIRSAEREILDLEKDIGQLEDGLRALEAPWQEAMAAIGLSPGAGTAEADSAMEVWREAMDGRRKWMDEEHRVQTIRRDIEAFETHVAQMCAAIAPEFAGDAPDLAAGRLTTALREAQDADKELRRLQKDIDSATSAIAALEKEHESAQDILADAARALALPGDGDLANTLERLRERRGLREDITAVSADLAGNEKMELAALRAELEDFEPDAAPARIAQLKAYSEQFYADVREAAATESEARRALDELTAGGDAATLAQEREEVAAELAGVTRQWLVRAAAAKLAARAIELHRESAQDPVIARISGLFSQATGGAFEGITVDYDASDQLVFFARRTGGENVPVDGLSDGTRDQLFLTLRLALLELRPAEPLPFIGDDILVSFDEERTAQVLELLGEFGRERQMILFTHHAHVAEIARERLAGRLDLIELEPAAD